MRKFICFNCGMYGHVCDHCPYVSVDKNTPNNNSDLINKAEANRAEGGNVVDMI